MSFILDALRKSETERQREAVPNVARVPLAAPRAQMPRWALACIGVLAAALVAVAAAWWRTESTRPSLAGLPTSTQASQPLSLATADPRNLPGNPPPSQGVAATAERAAVAAVEAVAPQEIATPPAATGNLAATLGQARSSTPIAEPTPQPRLLPNLAQIRAAGIDVPALDLQLHSYSDDPTRRFVFIDGRRYGEGERLEAGPQLERIVAEGAVLSQQGREFLLTAD